MDDELARRLDAALKALGDAPPPPLPGPLLARLIADAARTQPARRAVPRAAWMAMAASALLGFAVGAWDGAAGIAAPGAPADTLAEVDLLASATADDGLGDDT